MEKARLQEIADEAARILRQPPAVHGEGRIQIYVMVGELKAMAGLALEALDWRENVTEMLGKPGERSADIDVVWDHAGNAPAANLIGSLAITVLRTRQNRDRARLALGALLTAADNRHRDPIALSQAVERAKAFARGLTPT